MSTSSSDPGPARRQHGGGGTRKKQLECCFLFALFWSTGVTSDAAGREKYSLFVREVMKDVDVIDEKYGGVATALAVRKWRKPDYKNCEDKTAFLVQTDEGNLQDWCYDPRKGKWVSWVLTLASLRSQMTLNSAQLWCPCLHCPAIVHVSHFAHPWVKTAGLRPDRNGQICIRHQVRHSMSWINPSTSPFS